MKSRKVAFLPCLLVIMSVGWSQFVGMRAGLPLTRMSPVSVATELREVTLAAADGFVLHGRYESNGAKGPGILLLHQCNREGDTTGYENFSTMLANRGFNVLALDFRSYGNSVDAEIKRGDWKKTHDHMSGDVESAYQFLISRPEVISNEIAVAGASCGGREAISLAARHESIRTLVFLSSSIGGRFEEQYQSLTDLPVFCITSENDPFGRTAESMKQTFAKSRNTDSRLLIYKGDKHGTPLFEQDDNLESVILSWFERHLRNSS